MPGTLGLRESDERKRGGSTPTGPSGDGGLADLGAVPRLGRPRLLYLLGHFEVSDAGQMVLTVAPRLQRLGFEVLVGSLAGWSLLGEELEGRGVRAVAFGVRRSLDPRGIGRMLALLRRERIQILHAHRSMANLAARVLGRLADVPVVITSLDDTDLGIGLGGRLAEMIGAPLSDSVLTFSEAGRRHALETFGSGTGRVHLLRGAVEIPESGEEPGRRDALRRELGAGPKDLLVGTVGRLREPKKGLAIFLAAARLLARDVPRVRFALVGDGPDRGRLETRAAEEGVSHRTVFAGLRRDVTSVLRALDLFVEASLWEGLGLTVLEAMAAEAPIVATRVGGIPELIVDGASGLLVPPGDPAALARACAALLLDRERAARLAAAARRRAENEFPVDRLARDMSQFYRSRLAGARATSDRSSTAPWRRG